MRIAVYGASGYQGKLIVASLARRGIDVVLVGRSLGRLREAAAFVGLDSVRVADLSDVDRLAAAFEGCAAVINCAGPFTRSGTAVTEAAPAAGCRYVDTSGEQVQIKQTFDAPGSLWARLRCGSVLERYAVGRRCASEPNPPVSAIRPEADRDRPVPLGRSRRLLKYSARLPRHRPGIP